ncbi:MAG: hypothetical protein HY023_04040 [Chloroflexi bacterium]|nr:hypothetical protein [Chloroflexota bacterium]
MKLRNIISVSWSDHLVFGEGDGRLATPNAVRRRMECWRDELGAAIIHWRLMRTRIKGRFHAARGRRHPTVARSRHVDWDDFEVVPRLAHEAGLKVYLYVALFDEGWPLAPQKVREISYHNGMHGQHVAWQSEFSRQHPEYAVLDRIGARRQAGVLCLAYPEVRAHFRDRFLGLLAGRDFDGLFVCLRSQSRPADFADQFGFNEPVRREFQLRHGRNICAQDFDLQAWRDLLGEYLTTCLAELRNELRPAGLRLAVGAARGDVLGPPLGNTTLQWREWVERGLIDELVINQNSSQCPSMWHQLWPMHRGYGYLQNYLDGHNLPPLLDHLGATYAPAFASRAAKLYVARQWSERSESEEAALTAHPAVTGLVFSSFRFDNPGAVARGDWKA